jgi:hypothetical protein
MDFFIWRGCDVSSARQVINSNADTASRAVALLTSPTGLPDDPANNNVSNPTLCITSASWSTPINTGRGQLPPGTYSYKLIPIDTCTGQTGAPYDIPDLVITELGQQATLSVVLCETPSDCISVLVQRDGVVVGDVIPVNPQIDNLPVINDLSVNNLNGVYTDGAVDSILIDNTDEPPYDLRGVGHPESGPDVIDLEVTNGARPGRASVVVQEVTIEGASKRVKFAPPLTASPELKPYSFMDLGQRTGLYISPPQSGLISVLVPNIYPFSAIFPYVTFVNPFFAFKSIPIPSGFGYAASIVPFSSTALFSPENEMRVTGLTGLTAGNVGRPILLQGIGTTKITGTNSTVEVLNFGQIKVSDLTGVSIDQSFIGSKLKLLGPSPADKELEIVGVIDSSTVLLSDPSDPSPTTVNNVDWELTRKSISGCFNITQVVSSTECLVDTGVEPGTVLEVGSTIIRATASSEIDFSIEYDPLLAPGTFEVDSTEPQKEYALRYGPSTTAADLSVKLLENQYFTSAIVVTDGPLPSTAYSYTKDVKAVPAEPRLPAVPDPNNTGSGAGAILWMAVSIAVPKPGDVITWLDRTGIVVKVDIVPKLNPFDDPTTAPFNEVNVAVIPFNFLAIPWPAGLYRIVYRPQWPVSIGNYYINLEEADILPTATVDGVEYERVLKFEVRGNGNTIGTPDMPAGAPLDSGIVPDRSIMIDGKLLTIIKVEPKTRLGGVGPDFPINPLAGIPKIEDYAVVWASPFPEPGDPTKPLSNPVFFDDKVSYGIYATLSLELSPYIDRVGISDEGSFKRITRTSELTIESELWMNVETGQFQQRTGELPSSTQDTFNTLDQIVTQAGYSGGANGLLDKLRGPTATLTNRSFNDSIGKLIQTKPGGRYFAVNKTAAIGGCDTINISTIRDLRAELCGTFSRVHEVVSFLSANDGLAVMRMEEVTRTLPPERCPPGQEGTTVTELECRGIAEATPATKQVRSTEKMKVFWSGEAYNEPGAARKLRSLGLSEDEVTAALTRTPSGRVLYVGDISDIVQGVADLSGTGAVADDILDDSRIRVMSPCVITLDQIEDVISVRGVGGVVQRPIGTDPDTTVRVSDFSPVTVNLLDVVATNSVNMCDFDAFIQSIEDENTRNALAAVLAVVDEATNGIKWVAEELRKWWFDNPFYLAAKETIAVLTAAVNADPTMSCFFGPMNANGGGLGLPTLPAVEEGVLSFAGQFTIRLSLTRMVMSLLESLACKIFDALISLLPLNSQADAQRLVGCLPSIGDILALLPNIDLSVVFQCNFELYRLILRIIQSIISELSEILSLISGLTSGFINRSAQSANLACSSDQNLANIVGQAASALGLPASFTSAITSIG